MVTLTDWIWAPEQYNLKKKKHLIKYKEPLYIPASFSNIKWALQEHN